MFSVYTDSLWSSAHDDFSNRAVHLNLSANLPISRFAMLPLANAVQLSSPISIHRQNEESSECLSKFSRGITSTSNLEHPLGIMNNIRYPIVALSVGSINIWLMDRAWLQSGFVHHQKSISIFGSLQVSMSTGCLDNIVYPSWSTQEPDKHGGIVKDQDGILE